MGAFRSSLQQFTVETKAELGQILDGCGQEVHTSVTVGSSLTDAPGQPVESGDLRDSITLAAPTPNVREIATDLDYAVVIEEGGRRMLYQNHGPHSFRKTIKNFRRILSVVATRVNW